MNVADFLNINAEKFPMNPAVGFKKKDEWKEINWKQFRTLVFKTANALKNAGIGVEDKVAIYADNSAEWITFDLAVLSLGAITVPIYSTNNKEQTEYIINDAQAKIILAGSQQNYDIAYEIIQNNAYLQKIVVSKKAVWIKKDRSEYLEDFIQDADQEHQVVDRQPDDLATLIYTSGTTGIPKGVMLTHNNFVSAFHAHMEFFKFKNFENEHSLAFLPLSHVFERAWTLLCLTFGVKVSFLENPKLIASALSEVKPSMMCAVPRFYQKIYAGVTDMVKSGSPTKQKIFAWALKVGGEVADYKRQGKSVPFGLNLKLSLANGLVFNKIKTKMGGKIWFSPCGGASLAEDVSRFFDAIGLHVTVGYGMTETTATVTCLPVTNYEYGTVGVTMGDAQVKIAENGEVLVKGSGIMKGYYNKPEDTAAVFTEDGYMKTGDIGEITPNGNLVIIDRLKDLMKTSNGKYIAPQPIENAIGGNNLISQVMLVAEGKPYATAVIVPNFEALEPILANKNIPHTDWETTVKNPEVYKLYMELISEALAPFSGFEKVKKIVLLPKDFDIESGEITPSLKVKRAIVLKKFEEQISEMYH